MATATTKEETITTRSFNPDRLTPEQKTRLEDLLTTLETAVAQRRRLANALIYKALADWLANPAAREPDAQYMEIMKVIPDDRFPAYVSENSEELSEKETALLKRVLALPVDEQRKAIACALASGRDGVDAEEYRRYWKKIDKLYTDILAEFPGIVWNEDNVKSALNLGDRLKQEMPRLETAWPYFDYRQKLELVKAFLRAAYPDDEIDHIKFNFNDGKKFAASFLNSGVADVINLGPLFANAEKASTSLFMLIHELQHRRQYRLKTALKEGKLKPGTAEHYQARLFAANFGGGYLTPTTAASRLSTFARFRDYLEQPVETEANNLTMLACTIGRTGAAPMWWLNEKLMKAFSDVARPVDAVAHAVSYTATRALRAVGLKPKAS